MKNPNNKLLMKLLILVASSTALLVSCFEIVKQYLHANISIWESHVATIVFTTFITVFVTYYTLRQDYSLFKSLNRFNTGMHILQKNSG